MIILNILDGKFACKCRQNPTFIYVLFPFQRWKSLIQYMKNNLLNTCIAIIECKRAMWKEKQIEVLKPQMLYYQKSGLYVKINREAKSYYILLKQNFFQAHDHFFLKQTSTKESKLGCKL